MTKISFEIGNALFGGGQTFLRDLTDVGKLVSILSSNAMVIAGIIFIFLIILSGFNMITAGGDPQKMSRASSILTTAIVGFVVIVAAYFIIRILELVLGVSILS